MRIILIIILAVSIATASAADSMSQHRKQEVQVVVKVWAITLLAAVFAAFVFVDPPQEPRIEFEKAD